MKIPTIPGALMIGQVVQIDERRVTVIANTLDPDPGWSKKGWLRVQFSDNTGWSYLPGGLYDDQMWNVIYDPAVAGVMENGQRIIEACE